MGPSVRWKLEFCRRERRPLRVNVMSETAFWRLEGQGGHTAFLDCVELLRAHPELEVRVNDRHRGDVLHAHSWGPMFFARGLRYAGRRVLTVHALPETAEGAIPMWGSVTRRLVRGYLRSVYNFANVLIAVAPRSAELLRGHRVRPPIRVLPNPVRTDRFRASAALRARGRRRLGLAGPRPVVLGVGQLQPRKGIADFAAVARALPWARFVWVGGRPFGRVSAGIAEIDALMRRPPPNLAFAGLLDLARMPEVYNAADVLLFPSWHELSPYAPLEAAACGLPVVLRDSPEYRTLYPPGYVAARGPEGFVRAVTRVLRERRARARGVTYARRLAARFSPERYAAELAAIYDALACGRPVPVNLRPPMRFEPH